MICLLLALIMVFGLLPQKPLAARAADSGLEGKTVSVLGDSISTYTGISNNTSYNATLGGNAVYYSAGRYNIYRADTWWQQVIDALGMELLVNNSWSGSCVLNTRSGTVGAYADRCVELHNSSTGKTPDVILVFLGTNDFSYFSDTWGTAADVDYETLILDDAGGFTYAVPATTCEAYAIMLHKMQQRYPKAEIYCISLTARRDPDYTGDDKADVGQPTAANAELAAIARKFDCRVIDLENCGIDKAADVFDLYMGDKRVHPNKLGMDLISEAVVSALLGQDTDIYDVAFDLINVTGDGAHAVLPGNDYTVTLTEAEGFKNMSVTVTMGGEDVTASCYADGMVSIPAVTGDVVITAEAMERDPLNFRWEFDGTDLVTVTSDGNAENALTNLEGSVTDGVFSSTRYQMERTVMLLYDRPWILEWKGTGKGGVMLAADSVATTGEPFFFRRQASQMFAFGAHDGSQYNNYGITLPDTIDTTLEHTFRLENRIADDGSNMVYLYVDDAEIGALNQYFVGGNAQGTTSDWISGKDFLFNYIGTQSHPLTDMSVEYLRIEEDSTVHHHDYTTVVTDPTYTEGGYTTYTCAGCGDSYIADYTDAIALYSYRWEMQDNAMVSVTTGGNTANALTLNAGSVADGTFASARYTLENSVRLYHDVPWGMEWKASGDWSAMLLTSTAQSATEGMSFIFRTYNESGLLALGTYSDGSYHNYGIALTDYDLDMTQEHTYRLENRIAEDGSNMVYLTVDGTELGAMNNYYIGGTKDQGQTVDWVDGRDFEFGFMGSISHPLNSMTLEYFQVHEGGESETPERKTISILGASISTFGGTSNGDAADTTNSTIRDNVAYYPLDTIPDVGLSDTWWMQVAQDMDLRLLVNNAWSGSSLLHTRSGTVGAYVDRCVRLHDDTGDNAGEMPDIIGIQLGTNDFQYFKDTLGTSDIDYETLIVLGEDGSYTYAEPATSLEAAAIILHKISVRYPDAEVYYLSLSQRIDGYEDVLEQFNADLKTVVEHFGYVYVDIYNSGITQDNFSTYIGDNRVHPNRFGMDAYTEAVKKALLGAHPELTAYTVDFQLDNVTVDYGVDKQVLSGKAFTCTLTAPEYFKPEVTVTMGGEDITDSCYADGVVTIEAVTADVVITAEAVLDHEPQNYRWEFDGTDLATITTDGNVENVLTKLAGSSTDGVFTTTSYSLEKTIVLSHDLPWSVEWKCEGTWRNTSGSGGRMFTTTNVNADYNARYIFKSANSYLLAIGEKTSSGSHNYGIALEDHGIDGSALHTYRLENRVAEDGTNMVWLYVDGVEIGAMNNYYLGTTDQETTSDWLSGKDFLFPYIGTDTHGLNNCSIDYIQVWEGGADHYHSYTAEVTEPTYTEGGYTTYTCTGCGHSYVADYTDFIDLHTYRWELVDDAFVSVTTDRAEENLLSLQNGSISDGAFTNVLYTIDSSIHLYHDQPWVIEWKSSGDNARTAGGTSGGSGLLSSNTVLQSDEGTWFLYKRPSNYLIALCYRDADTSIQSGIALTDHNIDGSELHTYRLENRVAEDGSNMVYLIVDGVELGAMNNLFVSAVDQGETTDFLNGLDWTFDYMGITNYYLTNCSMEYMQVWEGGEPNSYEGKVISIMGDSISTFAGYIPVADGFNREHLARYPQDNLLTDVNETWWMQVVAELDAKLGINESWRGSTLSGAVPVTTSDTGENAAMSNLIRIQNMGSNGTPDVILLYGGTNDLAHVSKVGTFDPDTAPSEVDLTTTKWDNLADGFVHTLLRMRYFYPDAMIVALLPTYTASYYSDEKLAQGNAVMAEICEHYGIPYVDLRDSGVTADHLPDGIHPGEEGMDLITAAVLDLLLQQTIEPGENVVYPVTHELTHVKASLGHYKGISAGKAFEETLEGENMTVTVTMGSVDVTGECYADGKITIAEVTGALVITAEGAYSLNDHLQQMPDPYCGVNLWQVLDHDPEYHSADGWTTHSSGQVKSITFPVTPGDRLYASSFEAAGTNGGSMNGIRVTYFTEDGVPVSMTAAQVYSEFSENGWLTVPKGATAISIPMWTDSDAWDVHFLCILDGHLQQIPEDSYNDTNLWPQMDHDAEYYSANGWATHSSGAVKSVTFPVSPGDRLHASSFGAAGTNGSTTNGIRVTYFTQCGVLVSMTAAQVYEEFSEYGYLTVPEGAYAVSIPMWTDSSDWELYVLTLSDRSSFEGKVISVMGDSISTFAGYIPVADGFNLQHYARYPQDNLLTDVNETWWMQVLTALDAKLGINESWRSTEVYNYIDAEVNSTYDGTKACMASTTRIQNLGSNGTPDVILFYGGTNDINQSRPLGSFAPETAPTEVDLTSVKWDSVADAYVTAIMRMQYYYPDALIVAMLPTYTSGRYSDETLAEYNAVFAAICEHYGVPYVDLRYCGISTDNLPDGIHPDATGMDYITEAVLDTLLESCEIKPGEHIVHSVSHMLTNVTATLGHWKGVDTNCMFVETLTGEDMTVTVTMGDVDITSDCYADGKITIAEVTGNLVITASGAADPTALYKDHLQQLPENAYNSTNLWTALTPEAGYYSKTGWSSSHTSVTVPVSAGDQLWATSLQASGTNGGTRNGIRVTYFLIDGTVKTMEPDDVYTEFADAGYLTAPENAAAVCITMWNDSDSNEFYILTLPNEPFVTADSIHSIQLQSDGSYLFDGTYTLTDNGSYLKGSIGTDSKTVTLYKLNEYTYVTGGAVTYTENDETQYLYDYTVFAVEAYDEPAENGIFQVWRESTMLCAFNDLQSAANYCQNGDAIEITGDFTATEGAAVNKDITIDGNGHSVDVSGWHYAFIVADSHAELTLKNLAIDGGADEFRVDYSSVTYTNYTIPLKDGSLGNDPKRTQSPIIAKGSLTADNITVSNSYTASCGGAISTVAGSMTLKNCEFTHNYGTTYGGAVYIGSKFMDRTVYPVQSVVIEGCTFTDNYTGHGGAVYAFNTARLDLKDSTFKGNTANGGKGGAIDLATENTTKPAGAALGLDFMQTYVDGCTFEENWAGNDGFAIQSYDSDLYITDSDFEANVGVHPTSSVGTVSIEHYRGEDWRIYTCMTGCTFTGNVGPVSCYGDHSSPSDLEVTDCMFRENMGSESFLLYSAVADITDCQFVDEQAVFGVIDARIYENYQVLPCLTLTDVTFEDTIGASDILVRKQNHNLELNTYTVILKGTTSGNIHLWDGNAVRINGSHTGSVDLDAATAGENLTVSGTLNGTATGHPDTYTVILRYPYSDSRETAKFLYLEKGKTCTAREMYPARDGFALVAYTDSAHTVLWDKTAESHMVVYGQWETAPTAENVHLTQKVVLEKDGTYTITLDVFASKKVALYTDTVIRYALSEGLVLTPDSIITAHEITGSMDTAKAVWSETTAEAAVTITAENGVVDVTGYDFSTKYVGEDHPGSKLRITVTGIEAMENVLWGETMNISAASSGVWTDGAQVLELMPSLLMFAENAYVLDYAAEITLGDVDAIHLDAVGMYGFEQAVTRLELAYGTAAIGSEGVRYTPGSMKWDGYDRFYVFSSGTDGYSWSRVAVIPANNVYYEDSFIAATQETSNEGAGIFYTNGQKPEDMAEEIWNAWQNAWDQTSDGKTDASVTGGSDVHGWIEELAGESGFSGGSAHIVQSMTGQMGDALPKATFTFTGSGVDIYSFTNNQTGTILVKVDDIAGSLPNKYYILDALSASNGTAGYYQVPVISYTARNKTTGELVHSTFQVTITVTTAAGAGEYGSRFAFYLDGIRVYDPLGANAKDETVQDAYGDELNASFHTVRDLLLTADSFTGESGAGNGFVFIDQLSGDEAGNTDAIGVYEEKGPKNEVYLAKGQAIAFKVSADTSRVQVGLRSLTGDTVMPLVSYFNGTSPTQGQIAIAHTADMFYELTPVNGYVVIRNTSDALLSITKVKLITTGDPQRIVCPVEEVSQEQILQAVEDFDALPVEVYSLRSIPAEPEAAPPSVNILIDLVDRLFKDMRAWLQG